MTRDLRNMIAQSANITLAVPINRLIEELRDHLNRLTSLLHSGPDIELTREIAALLDLDAAEELAAELDGLRNELLEARRQKTVEVANA
jgi:hypothetical protein